MARDEATQLTTQLPVGRAIGSDTRTADVVFAPFVVLAVTYMVGMILGSSPDEVTRRNRAIAAGFVVLVAVGVFFYMLPVLDATVIPEDAWRSRMWLSTWI